MAEKNNVLDTLITAVTKVQNGNPVRLKVILDMIFDYNQLLFQRAQALQGPDPVGTWNQREKIYKSRLNQSALVIKSLIELVQVNQVAQAIILDTIDDLKKEDFLYGVSHNIKKASDLVLMHKLLIKESK